MHIALVSEHASPLALAGGVDSGGQNIYVANVAKQLAVRGFEVDVFTRRDSDALPEVIDWHPGVRVINVTAGPSRYVAKENLLEHMESFGVWMRDFFRRQSRAYDVVHANFFMSGLASLHVTTVFKLPLVMTFHALGRVRRQHQGEADRFPPSRIAIEDQLIRHADRIIAECPQDFVDLTTLYGADADKIDVIPCGYDALEFSPMDRDAARREMGWDRDAFSILQLGRMVPRKGVDNVIRALGVLRRDHGVDARLYVVGGNSNEPDDRVTPEIGRLRTVAGDAGVADLVTFVGRRGRTSLRACYGAADVFVTTPWYEPFGITPVEAMACGRSVIGADVGGIRSTVRHGQTGFLVPPNDPAALAQHLAQLARDPALCKRMGMAGKRRAEQCFTWRRVAHDLMQVYDQLSAPTLPMRAGIPRRARSPIAAAAAK
jgi:glycosyltransferase involved in cell wall biosynthesis